jgi:Na+-transporting methylmalonyl-CoA/oxaloacetate decarboxylase gamma subunit
LWLSQLSQSQSHDTNHGQYEGMILVLLVLLVLVVLVTLVVLVVLVRSATPKNDKAWHVLRVKTHFKSSIQG